MDGRLTPGDRLLSVNEVSLEHSSLSYALHMMHSLVDGCRVRLRVAKPMRPLTTASLTATASRDSSASIPNSRSRIATAAGAARATAAGAVGRSVSRAATATSPHTLLDSFSVVSECDREKSCDRLSPNTSQQLTVRYTVLII